MSAKICKSLKITKHYAHQRKFKHKKELLHIHDTRI